MAKAPRSKLPPPTARDCWGEFLKWVAGIPLVCVGGLGIVGLGLWAMGGGELMWQAQRDMGTAFFWIVAIILMYPLMLFVWVAELRSGLKAARDWEAMSPEAQAAAIAEAQAAVTKRRARKKG